MKNVLALGGPTTSFADGSIEMWGGVECTVNRVGEAYFDQLRRSGHAARVEEDLEAIAALGLRALRFPVLWERLAPEHPEVIDWRWSDAGLARLATLGVRPIVGLLHHGSGPRYTSLVDPEFPEKLARYARRVAERYPWVVDYTPINEPLTTARFSGLYGHWYPHASDDATFARALIGQCRGIVLAMEAIRETRPDARLVQTEDLGRIYGTPEVEPVTSFLRARRWLSLDLLAGRLTRHHPLWNSMRAWGIGEDELAFFVERARPPDLVGVNHYLTSDRFLDERYARYPSQCASAARVGYADVEAVRARLEAAVDTSGILRDVWDRYELPVAVTEAHLNGTREDQLRWLHEVWEGARQLRSFGVDVRAVTVWSLLGAFDWNKLVTREDGFYESGVFDLRAPRPRPTALARLVRKLATRGSARDEPLVHAPGWWRRPDRLFHPQLEGRSESSPPNYGDPHLEDHSARPLLILGASSSIGCVLARVAAARGLAHHCASREDLARAENGDLEALLAELRPWAVVDARGYFDVDAAERERELCFHLNVTQPTHLALACARLQLPLVRFSSEHVFDGARADGPYSEGDPVAPLGVYGHSLAAMEREVLAAHPSALIARASAFFSAWSEDDFVADAIRGRLAVDEEEAVASPTYGPHFVHAALDLLIDGECGLWHLATPGATRRNEFARRAAALVGASRPQRAPRPGRTLGAPEALRAPRPRNAAFRSIRGWLLPDLDEALANFARDFVHQRKQAAAGRREEPTRADAQPLSD